ncbi:MAG: hypothetical protein AB7R89_09640 [Dehalococcoidia bacterium]
MKSLEDARRVPPAFGVRLERSINAVEERAAAGLIRSILLGVGLGFGSVVGGIGAFLLVWFVLVEVLH